MVVNPSEMWSVDYKKCKLAYCRECKMYTEEYTVELAFFFSCILHFISGTFGTLGAQQTSLFGGNALGG